MKALRPFGYAGANEGKVQRGREFSVATEQRARDLEDAGLAFRMEAKMHRPPENKMEPLPENKAAEAGPLDSPGGTTGEDEPQPSSPPDRPRRGRPPRRLREVDSES